jgi:Flp pilus assembly protein TadG
MRSPWLVAATRSRGRLRDGERGYVDVLVAILLPVLLGMAAFAVDVGNWYVTVKHTQNAADAAALAGVTHMPGDLDDATASAHKVAADNGFGASSTAVSPVSGRPSQLKVTASRTVRNAFGALFGIGTTKITRSAVADYQKPVPMGSPCNEFGNDPDAQGHRSAQCGDLAQFWANVGSPGAYKTYGDAFADDNCSDGGDDCSPTNSDYSADGYFYKVKVSKPIHDLRFQAFDPAFVSVGDRCEENLAGADAATNPYNRTVSGRYASGAHSKYCTGDMLYDDSGAGSQSGVAPDTTFTVREPVSSSSAWDPKSYPPVGGDCTQTFKGVGDEPLNSILDQDSGAYDKTVASEFRQWVTLCTISDAQPGTYFVQVQSGNGDGHNRFSLRASGAGGSHNDDISIAGHGYMAVYANVTGANTTFDLAQVPPGAAGEILKIRLWDIGDVKNDASGHITVLPPKDSELDHFDGCVGKGPEDGSGDLANCEIPANPSYNGRWQTISVPLPKGYNCHIDDPTGCWIKLRYDYGEGNKPRDTTSWQVSLEGTPVRIVR